MHSQTSGDQKPRKIIGVDAFADTPGKSEAGILGIAKTTARKIGLPESNIVGSDVIVDMRWNAGSYSHGQ